MSVQTNSVELDYPPLNVWVRTRLPFSLFLRMVWVKCFIVVLLLPGLTSVAASGIVPWNSDIPDTVLVPSGALRLRGLLWRPTGSGPFPALFFCHGSGPTNTSKACILGPVFANHGYVFLYLFRRGDGLSADQSPFMGALLERERMANGEEAKKRLQLHLLTTDHLDDVRAGISFLKKLGDVDSARVAVAGHSFGGQLAILSSAGDSSLAAVVAFAPAAASWNGSPGLRTLLLEAVRRTMVPILLIHAANDYSTAPGTELAAELSRLGKPVVLRIYPSVGRTPDEGHDAVYNAVPRWEDDVFKFLDRYVKN